MDCWRDVVFKTCENTPLHLANCPYFWDADLMAREKALRFEISQHLVRQGADLDAENIFHCKPIDLAIFHGYEGTVRLLEEEGVKPSIFGAAFQGDVERIKDLLEEGVDLDLKGRYRRTAFAEAHLRGHFAVEAFLTQQGCSRELPHPEHLKSGSQSVTSEHVGSCQLGGGWGRRRGEAALAC
eukprot:g20746.t1